MKKLGTAVMCLVLAIAVVAGLLWYKQRQDYRNDHVFLGEDVYPKNADRIDLRSRDVSIEYYSQLQALLPDCEILWNVPFQGGSISCDTTELTVDSLSMEDVEVLAACFPKLTAIHAENCHDYAALQEASLHWTVDYSITLSGSQYDLDVTSLTLEAGDYEELMANLAYLPQLASVHFPEPNLTAEELLSLVEAYPSITFTWEKTVLGTPYPSTITELDLSGAQLDSTEVLEAELRYFPRLETILLGRSNLDSETLAAYRNRVRDQYKVVWMVKLGKVWTRTDTTTYVPVREHDEVRDGDLTELKYCEDLIVVDLGHMQGVTDLDWVNYTPHLQYLILVETWVSDITPIGSLKELIYLELFKCPKITDYTPLLGCTALQDLNLSTSNGDVSVLAEMTWLDALWANNCGATEAQKQLLRDSLPDTLLELDSPWWLGGGWRDRPNYYVMRDILGMKYIPTGAYNPRYN